MTDLIVATQLFSTLFMTGLIWFIQIVHYPLFASVGRAEFTLYSRRHQKLTTFVVGPVMLLEAGSALAWLCCGPGTSGVLMWLSLALLLIVWLSTAFLQVPAHARLALGFSETVQQRLVRTNWIRTVAWTLRGGLVITMVLLQGPAMHN